MTVQKIIANKKKLLYLFGLMLFMFLSENCNYNTVENNEIIWKGENSTFVIQKNNSFELFYPGSIKSILLNRSLENQDRLKLDKYSFESIVYFDLPVSSNSIADTIYFNFEYSSNHMLIQNYNNKKEYRFLSVNFDPSIDSIYICELNNLDTINKKIFTEPLSTPMRVFSEFLIDGHVNQYRPKSSNDNRYVIKIFRENGSNEEFSTTVLPFYVSEKVFKQALSGESVILK